MKHRRNEIVLLITLWGYSNFGNRLQAIALKHMIEQCGYDVQCVPNVSNSQIKYRLKGYIARLLGFIGVKRIRGRYLKETRAKSLRHSSDRILKPYTKKAVSFDMTTIKSTDYYAAVTGSDQVWHKWSKNDNELDFFYLSFMPQCKRISYAASFGFDEVPESDKNKHIAGLKGMSSISCRERSGCELVRSLVNRDSELVLDPTLCVGTEYWQRLESAPHYKTPDRYLFLMMLGDSSEMLDKVKECASRESLEIIDIMDKNNKAIWSTSIGEFLWLIHHAQIVFTDSFHCTVFSILFARRFCVYRRRGAGFEKMFNRIETLLNTLGLSENECNGYDSSSVHERLESQSRLSQEWLSNALAKAKEKDDQSA